MATGVGLCCGPGQIIGSRCKGKFSAACSEVTVKQDGSEWASLLSARGSRRLFPGEEQRLSPIGAALAVYAPHTAAATCQPQICCLITLPAHTALSAALLCSLQATVAAGPGRWSATPNAGIHSCPGKPPCRMGVHVHGVPADMHCITNGCRLRLQCCKHAMHGCLFRPEAYISTHTFLQSHKKRSLRHHSAQDFTFASKPMRLSGTCAF